jgi:zinc and cadmium transporter
MTLLGQILLAVALISVISPVLAALILAVPKIYENLKKPLLAYAVGILLAVTFLDILPEAIHKSAPEPVLLTTLLGFVAFFILEKFLHVHEGQSADHPPHQTTGVLVLVGASLHNFVDGVLLTSSFSISTQLGLLTAFAIFAHEVPHELGDFIVLLQSGFSMRRAFWLNFITALVATAGSLAAYFALPFLAPQIPLILAIAGASFLYISATNLAPSLRHEENLKASLVQIAVLLGAIACIYLLMRFFG